MSRLSVAGAAALILGAPFAPAALAGGGPGPPGSMKVCVYYDAGDKPSYKDGRLHAIMLENLLGHFREADVRAAPASEYRSLDLTTCDRAAYMGSFWDAPLSKEFLNDVAAYRKPFLWINYNVRHLQSAMGKRAFAAKTGFVYDDTEGFLTRAPKGVIPDFYRNFLYKGERFSKMAALRPDGTLVAAPDIALMKEDVTAVVLSTAVDPGSGRATPYVTEKDGFFFVADNPFLFIHERDRYLIVADLLFDFLRLPPRSAKRRALVRLEDVHPEYDLDLLRQAVDLLKSRKVPFAISLIPEYVAPGTPESAGVDLGRRPEFVAALRYAQANGGTLLLHGWTHDVSRPDASCPALGSGFDYEFWDRCRQAPLSYDSADFARERIERAKSQLAAAGLHAVAWVTPHYAASSADSLVFAKAFDRTVQRVTYLQDAEPGAKPVFVAQFFPYTVYKDHYGQFVWPENLGYVPMPWTRGMFAAPPDIGDTARLSRVIRDGWASFFWHPQLILVPGEKERLERTIDSIRAAGYEFTSLRDLRERGE